MAKVVLVFVVLTVCSFGTLPDPYYEYLFNDPADVTLHGGAQVVDGYLDIPATGDDYASDTITGVVPLNSSATIVTKFRWEMSNTGSHIFFSLWPQYIHLHEYLGSLRFVLQGDKVTSASDTMFVPDVPSEYCVGITNEALSNTYRMYFNDGEGDSGFQVADASWPLSEANIDSVVFMKWDPTLDSHHVKGKLYMWNVYTEVLTDEQILEACTENYASAIGDPHITSIFGCHVEAPFNQTSAILMECEDEKLSVLYNEEWGNHIHTVSILSKTHQDNYLWKMMKQPKIRTVCGNTIEFHRYIAGINLRMLSITNQHNVTGMFADKSCLN